MCGRFVLRAETRELAERFSVDEVVGAEPGARWVSPRFNIAPTEDVVAVTSSRDGAVRRLAPLRWGLVPPWADDPAIGNRMINARSETLEEKGAYRSAFATRRCLVPADGFYEWRQEAGTPSGRAAGGRSGRSGRPRRTPFFIHPADGRTMALAGLWEVWHGPGGAILRSCTIVTTAANRTLAAVHDRMPVVVGPDDWGTWLAPSPLVPEEAARLLRPAPDDALVLHPVSDRVNRAGIDGPDLIDEIDPVAVVEQAADPVVVQTLF